MSNYPPTCDACRGHIVGVYPYTCYLWKPVDGGGHRAHYVCNPCRKALLHMTGMSGERLCPDALTENQRTMVTLGAQP